MLFNPAEKLKLKLPAVISKKIKKVDPVSKRGEIRRLEQPEIESIKKKARARALAGSGILDLNDNASMQSDVDQQVQHADLHRKVTQLEDHLLVQRQAMEDNPGGVTSDMEAKAISMEREARAMRVEIDVSAHLHQQDQGSKKITSPIKSPVKKNQDDDVAKISTAAYNNDDIPTPRGVKDASQLVGSDSNQSMKSPSKFLKGAKVEALYNDKDVYYPGVIGVDRGNGTYDVHYDDGEIELNVKEILIRLLILSPPAKPRATSLFKISQRVEACYRAQDTWYPGKIVVDREDGTYDVLYDDGENEERVREDLIREDSTPPVVAASRSNQGQAIGKSNVDNDAEASYGEENFEDEDGGVLPQVVTSPPQVQSPKKDEAVRVDKAVVDDDDPEEYGVYRDEDFENEFDE